MVEDRRKQFNTFISEDTIRRFKDTVARKYGVYAKNQWSFEVDQALRFYISVGGILPNAAHIHTNSHENSILTSHHSKEVRDTPEMKTSIVVKNDGVEGNYDGPINENPLQKDFFSRLGIDLTDPDSITQNLTEEDIKTGERMLTDPEFAKQFKKDSSAKFRAKKARIHNKEWKIKFEKMDKVLRPELALIKQHLGDTIPIEKNTLVTRIQIYNAFVVATDKRHQTTFANRLREYTDHGYFEMLDTKENKFKVTDKFLKL